MANRLIAIGDIHGCSSALRKIFEAILPDSTDTIVTLGDYINKGPDGRGVIDQLIQLQQVCKLIPLLGNHEQLLLFNRDSRIQQDESVERDPITGMELFSETHFRFLDSCKMYFETAKHIFVHANYDSRLDLDAQEARILLWLSLDLQLPKKHRSGKTAFVGHTPQRNGKILDRGHLIGIDTYCHGGGFLTAIDVESRQIWQTKQES